MPYPGFKTREQEGKEVSQLLSQLERLRTNRSGGRRGIYPPHKACKISTDYRPGDAMLRICQRREPFPTTFESRDLTKVLVRPSMGSNPGYARTIFSDTMPRVALRESMTSFDSATILA